MKNEQIVQEIKATEKSLKKTEEKLAGLRKRLEKPEYAPEHADYGFSDEDDPCFAVNIHTQDKVRDCNSEECFDDLSFSGAYHVVDKVGNIVDDLRMIKQEPPEKIIRGLYDFSFALIDDEDLSVRIGSCRLAVNHEDRVKISNALRQWDYWMTK